MTWWVKQGDALEQGRYAVGLDGKWLLEDFSEFSRKLEQVYFATEALFPHLRHADQHRIDSAFRNFPWRGGFSVVNLYRRLKSSTPHDARPDVLSIKYASPGAIELLLNLPTIIQISASIASIIATAGAGHKLYHSIHKGLQERKLLRLDVRMRELEVQRDEYEFVLRSAREIADFLGIEKIEELHERTGHPLTTLKVLLSYYRRLSDLADFQEEGMANFPLPANFEELL